MIKDLIELIRPRHWIKNIFVFAGLVFGDHWRGGFPVGESIGVFFAFCFVASGIYAFNDIIDREKDKHHPRKSGRPIPSGRVSVAQANGVMLLCLIGGLLLGAAITMRVFVILCMYVLLNVAYTVRLKQVVLLDVFCIATGFMLRILAGTWGLDVTPSKWLILCGLMVTLFLGFAKRYAELSALKHKGGEHREVLKNYDQSILNQMIGISSACTIISYSLYTMSPETIRAHQTDDLIATVPFVIYGIYRYIFLLYRGFGGGEPVHDLLTDRHMIFTVIAWLGVTLGLFWRG